MPEVAIVGAGLIGRGWAILFARAGWQVQVTDIDNATLSAAPARLLESMTDLRGHGLIDDVDGAMARIRFEPVLAEAVRNVDLVQENGPETVEAKAAIFRELDAHAPPHAVLASSSSSIVASKFTADLAGRHRCLIGHPVNPPHLVPVVELCGAPWTSPETLGRAKAIYLELGQIPVTINRELEGFVLNRLQGALLAEAFRLVGEGVISPDDLDKTVKDGLGMRWSFMGPFETIDLNAVGGIEDYCRRYTGFYRRLSEDVAQPTVWDEPNIGAVISAFGPPMAADERERKSAWRDSRLAALMAHKISAEQVL